MARKKSVSRELVAQMMKRILVEIERPTHAGSLGAMPDVDAELSKIDAFVNRLINETQSSEEFG